MSEEGFHEIQLNGKQLVFLFITVTVVSVVIFLCGVLVGRGVRAERADAAVDSSVAPVPDAPDPVAQGTLEAAPAKEASAQASATTDPVAPAPQPADEELSYYKRLEGNAPPKDELKPAPPREPATTEARPADAPAAVRRPPPPAPAVQAPSKPQPAAETAGGFSVQIAALRDRAEADGIVKRLSGKGYPAYVLAPPGGGGVAVYRVRVGKYKNRGEAETIAARLEKEEQFRPYCCPR